MYKKILAASLILCAFNAEAKQPSRFELMDANEDKLVDYNEFSLANPNFTKMAYDIIDENKDNKVSLEEWNNFMNKHSSAEGMKLDVEKRSTLKAKEKPDNPTLPTSPTVASPSSISMPKVSSPTDPTTKEVKKTKEIVAPSSHSPKRILPVLKPSEVKVPQIKKPQAPQVKQVQEPSKVNVN